MDGEDACDWAEGGLDGEDPCDRGQRGPQGREDDMAEEGLVLFTPHQIPRN